MKNNLLSIKTLFVKKMAYSAVIQFIFFALILILAKNYFKHNQLNFLTINLIINDSFTREAIGRYHLLKNKNALDLELYNLQNERKLDSIKFISNKSEVNLLGSCQDLNNKNYKVCRTANGLFSGITPVIFKRKILGNIIAKKQYNSFYLINLPYGLLLAFMIIVGIFLFNFLFLFLSMKNKIEYNIKYLLDFISYQSDKNNDISKIDIEEYKKIAQKFIDEQAEIAKLQKEKTYYLARKNIAEQVAHDIRSPLTAINTAVSDISAIPENIRVMIKNASRRINDIANNFL